jgi:cytochrome P450
MPGEPLTLETLDIIGEDTYAAHGYPHEAWAFLRKEDPVHWFDRPFARPPFWAITKHADIVAVSRRPRLFVNAPRLAVFPEFDGEGTSEGDDGFAHHLLNMDPPQHADYRKVSSHRFTPRALRPLEPEIEQITRETLDALAADGEEREIDFVERVSARIPLAVLAEMLGVPRDDWKLMFRWTNEIAGATDPEYQQGTSASETGDRGRNQLFEYFAKMAVARRAKPTDDIVSVVTNATLSDGEPLPPFELLSYFFLLVVAGNETTRNAISGGLLALIENPDQLELLRRDPSLIDSAVEEIVRWTTPVIQFCRTATEDVELRGKKIRAGQSLCLFYPSANRDEEVFDDPFAFRVDRKPNRHLAFGIGEHFCLGANLARAELRVIFRQLVERVDSVELAGPVERLRSSFLGGIKHMPLRLVVGPRCEP